jgi:hypothetical protein
MVKNLITIEDAYINTYHPDFMGGANAIFNVFDPAVAYGSLEWLCPGDRLLTEFDCG